MQRPLWVVGGCTAASARSTTRLASQRLSKAAQWKPRYGNLQRDNMRRCQQSESRCIEDEDVTGQHASVRDPCKDLPIHESSNESCSPVTTIRAIVPPSRRADESGASNWLHTAEAIGERAARRMNTDITDTLHTTLTGSSKRLQWAGW